MLSKIITSKKAYDIYLNKYLTPSFFNSNPSEAIVHFTNSIMARERGNICFLSRYLLDLDDTIEIKGKISKDKLYSIELHLKALNISQISSLLCFTNTRKVGNIFYTLKSGIVFKDLNKKLQEKYFDNTNKWDLGFTNPISLVSIHENADGILLLMTKIGEEVKYINEKQEYVQGKKTNFFNIFISKTKNVLSIGGIKQKKEMTYIINSFLKIDLGIDVGNPFLYIDHHFNVFESKCNSLTRKGEIEIQGTNTFQNNTSRNTKESNLKEKKFEGDSNSTGGYIDINTKLKNINIGFDAINRTFTIAKNDVLVDEYISILDFFINEIYLGKEQEKTIYDIFVNILSGKEALINISKEEFEDDKDIRKEDENNKYGIEFDIVAKYKCDNCNSHQSIRKIDITDEIKCYNCNTVTPFSDIELNKFFLGINADFYQKLIPTKFKRSAKTKALIGEYKKTFDKKEYTFIIELSNTDDKKGLVVNNDKQTIYIFISPKVYNSEEKDIYKIQAISQKCVMVYFNLEIFETLNNTEKRNKLFENIIANLKETTNTFIQYGDSYENVDLKGAMIKSEKSKLTNK